MQQTLTYTLNNSQTKDIFEHLKSLGTVVENSSEYVKWSIKGGDWSALMYTSGKFVLQSKNDIFCEEIKVKFSKDSEFQPHIGCDEVGKGDYFGPLVVCACYVGQKDLEKIKDYGVVDSKKLCDEKMIEIGKLLTKNLQYEVKVINPKEYNELTEKFNNVSILLSKSHAEVAEKLLKKVKGRVEFVVVDQFSKNKNRLNDEFKLEIPLRQYHHAESDIAVAAASIIARFFFLLEFEKMNKKYNMKFPLGATHVISFGKSFVKKFGVDELKNVAKVSFRTTGKIISFF